VVLGLILLVAKLRGGGDREIGPLSLDFYLSQSLYLTMLTFLIMIYKPLVNVVHHVMETRTSQAGKEQTPTQEKKMAVMRSMTARSIFLAYFMIIFYYLTSLFEELNEAFFHIGNIQDGIAITIYVFWAVIAVVIIVGIAKPALDMISEVISMRFLKEEASVHCPKCDTMLKFVTKFCAECGESLDEDLWKVNTEVE